MLPDIKSDLFSINNECYYFAIYLPKKNSWYINNHKFILSSSKNKILGQYISSLWFKTNIDVAVCDGLQVAIIKLSNKDCLQQNMHRYINLLNNTDSPNDLDFICLYSRITRDNLNDLIIQLKTTPTTYKETKEKIGLTFSKSTHNKELLLYCPGFYL